MVVPPRRNQQIALLALLAGATAIGFAPIFVRLSEVGPIPTAFWRVALALPVLALWRIGEVRRETRRAPERADVALLVVAGLSFACDLAVWHWSITLTTVANATLFSNFAPLVVTPAAYFLFHERIRPAFLLGLALAIGGAIVLIGRSFELSTERLVGDGLGMSTALFYACYMLAVSRLRRRVSTATIMLWSGVVTAIFLLPIALAEGGGPLAPSTLYGWSVVCGLALFSHAGGQGMIAYAFAHLPASFASVALLLQPAVAAVLAWLLFGEALGLAEVIGGAIILAGIVIARRASDG